MERFLGPHFHGLPEFPASNFWNFHLHRTRRCHGSTAPIGEDAAVDQQAETQISRACRSFRKGWKRWKGWQLKKVSASGKTMKNHEERGISMGFHGI